MSYFYVRSSTTKYDISLYTKSRMYDLLFVYINLKHKL